MSRQPRRVVAEFMISLDGRINGPGGEFDMGWIVPHAVSPGASAHLQRSMATATTVLLGRKNHDGFFSYWPPVADDPDASAHDRSFSTWLTNTDKIVFSTTIDSSNWANTTVTGESPAEVAERLRFTGNGDIIVLSSMSIIRQLLRADAVDHLSITLAPEIVGGGERLLLDLEPTSWVHTAAHITETGALCTSLDRRR